jgi:hypothetical protein
MAGRFVPFVCEDTVQFLIVQQGAGRESRFSLCPLQGLRVTLSLLNLAMSFMGVLGNDHEHDGDGSRTL